jgi:hypothetical protein
MVESGRYWRQKNVGYICNFQKMPKVKNRPKGESSPNLVALFSGSKKLVLLTYVPVALTSAFMYLGFTELHLTKKEEIFSMADPGTAFSNIS